MKGVQVYMSKLQDNLDLILNDKNTNLKPENLKERCYSIRCVTDQPNLLKNMKV